MPVVVGRADWRPAADPPSGRPGRPAAVLALLFPDQDDLARVVLIERSSGGGHHSGEVSFPGGKSEPEDADVDRDRAARGGRGGRPRSRGRRRPGRRRPRTVLDPGQRLRGDAGRGHRRTAPGAAPVAGRGGPHRGSPDGDVPAGRAVRHRRAHGPRLAAALRRLRHRRPVRLGRDGARPEPARGDPRHRADRARVPGDIVGAHEATAAAHPQGPVRGRVARDDARPEHGRRQQRQPGLHRGGPADPVRRRRRDHARTGSPRTSWAPATSTSASMRTSSRSPTPSGRASRAR